VTKTLGLLILVGLAGVRAVSADSRSAQLMVGVTVVRSCEVDARPADKTSPLLRLTCTKGAQSTVRISEMPQRPSAIVTSDSDTILTLNF
jgi:hypothetical protein